MRTFAHICVHVHVPVSVCNTCLTASVVKHAHACLQLGGSEGKIGGRAGGQGGQGRQGGQGEWGESVHTKVLAA